MGPVVSGSALLHAIVTAHDALGSRAPSTPIAEHVEPTIEESREEYARAANYERKAGSLGFLAGVVLTSLALTLRRTRHDA